MPDSARFPSPASPPRIDADYWSLRLVDEVSESLGVRKNVALPPAFAHDRGAMATVYAGGGYGYAATGDTSPRASRPPSSTPPPGRGRAPATRCVDSRTLPRAAAARRVRVAGVRRPGARPAREWLDLLMDESKGAGIDPRIVDWNAAVEVRTATHRLVTSEGGDVVQRYRFLFPGLSVTAHADGDTQTRTLNGYRGICQQGGPRSSIASASTAPRRRIAEEALELLAAPNCPSGHDGRRC